MWGKEEIGLLCKMLLNYLFQQLSFFFFFWRANTNVVVTKQQASLSLF